MNLIRFIISYYKDKKQLMNISPSKTSRPDVGSEKKTIQLTASEVQRIIDLGFRMKMILMQPDALKLVQQIMKTIKKMNSSTFRYKQKCISFIEKLKADSIKNIFNLNQSPSKSKFTEKDIKVDNLQTCRQQLIQRIVQQLSNARQDTIRIEQFDPSLTFSNIQQTVNVQDAQFKESVSIIRRQSEEVRVQELKKVIAKMQSECKNHKKLIEDLNKLAAEKQQKIQTLRTKISKLQQHIIRQVKVQGQSELKIMQTTSGQLQNQNVKLKMQNENNLIKSEALQRQVVQLKRQIQALKMSLTQSLQPLGKKKSEKQDLKEKQSQFYALSKEYAILKEEVSLLINEKKSWDPLQDSLSDDDNDQGQEDIFALRAQLQIMKEKYEVLENTYYKLIQDLERNNEDDFIKKSSQLSIPSTSLLKMSKQRKKSEAVTSKNKTPVKKVSQLCSDDQSIIRDIQEINKIQTMSDSFGICSFDNIINPNELAAKIPGFQFNNSIIHKINSSKFIQSFEYKLSFVLQYTCLLELYFKKNFRNALSQQMMMEETITIKPVSMTDLNPAHLADSSQSNERSFMSVNSSKMSGSVSSNRMFINNQFSISEYAKFSPYKSQKLISMSEQIIKKPSEHIKKKVDSIQESFKQISSLIPSEYLNPHELGNDPQFISRIMTLKHNKIAIIISNLVKENEVFKKCLNQMIKNQQSFTKINNQIYFDEDGSLRRRSSNNLEVNSDRTKNKDKDKDNCSIM